MKLAFINIYQNLVDRGAETFVKEVSERLSKKHEVKIFSGEKIPPARWPILWRLFIDPQGLTVAWFTLKLIPKILKEKYDVVIPLNGGWQAAIVRIVAWLNGSKMVISGQSGVGWDDRNNLWCFPNTFAAISSFAKKWAKRANPFVKSVYIPNGVDTKKFKPEGGKIEIDLKKPIILCVGALTKTKRIDLVIKAVSKIKDASLLIVGKGDQEEKLQMLGTKLLGDRFRITSFPHEKMPEVYRAGDIFTLVSEPYYSFENVLVEAMATNIPVVANNDPIRREIVGKAGILVNPKNIEEYSVALQEALTKNWGDMPREQAKKFDWDKIAEEYKELINNLLH
jgi:glycosyltransferase involved in cell wall biosynthesis